MCFPRGFQVVIAGKEFRCLQLTIVDGFEGRMFMIITRRGSKSENRESKSNSPNHDSLFRVTQRATHLKTLNSPCKILNKIKSAQRGIYVRRESNGP